MFLNKAGSQRLVRLGYIALALAIAILYDICVWDAQMGFGFLLWVVASLTLFTLCIFRVKKDRQKWAVLFSIPIIVMAIDTLLYQNSLVTHVVPTVIVVLSLFYFAVYPSGNPNNERFLLRTIPLFRSIDLPFLQWAKMYKDIFRWRDDARKDTVRKVLIGLAIALPLIILFGWLFALADEVFKDWLIRVLDIEWVDVWRLFRTLVMTLFLGSLIYSVVTPEYIVSHKEVTPKRLDTIIVSIVLFLVNVLFGIFVFFQFKYLFGGNVALLESGLTYAEYARKGFFELCWVIGLAAIMLLVIYRSFVFHKRSWIVTILQTVLIAQVGVIAASALARMNLYQEAFGYTVLRLYVEWFLYFVLAVLAFAGVSLIARISFRTFFYTTLVFGVAAFATVTSVNVDNVIAKENIRRFVEDDAQLDFRYLGQLSTDTASAYLAFAEPAVFENLSGKHQQEIASLLGGLEKDVAQRESWKELHLGIIKAAEDLRAIDAALQERLREVRQRQRAFENVETALSSKPYATCQSFDEQPVRDKYPYATFTCAYKHVLGIQYVYVLATPHKFYDSLENEAGEAMPVVLSILDLTNKVERVSFELPRTVKKESADTVHAYYNNKLYQQVQYDETDHSVRYILQQSYRLLTDGRVIETDYHTGTHRLHGITHDGATVRKSHPIIITSL